ncbi:hypothetical protein [Calothrix sp. 336/3]|uniref:hypothetical protein n=1 Tax=Calothrix sp. 336/3 TaxID=1337936 RepID=UPI0004E38D8C|nr:hypothetical protein [Calothrix sp. 336/3]AKG23513.1 hypothetical protein IJ00_21495 [Calothrix sp. 336/3]
MKVIYQVLTTAAITWTLLSGRAIAGTFTIGQNFTGTTLKEVETLNGFSVTPPDIMGAVGKNHFVEFTNGVFAIYDKTNGTNLKKTSSFDFWHQIAGVEIPDNFLSTPRMLFDSHSDRWFAVQLDFSEQGNKSNNFLLAVSQTADPTGGWKGWKINTDPTNTTFAEFLNLGLDADGVYLAANTFNTSDFSSSQTLISLSKSDLLSATPTIANRKTFNSLDAKKFGATIQPVINQSKSDGHTTLLGVDSNVQQLGTGKTIKKTQLGNNSILTTNDISVNSYNLSPLAVQPNKTALDSGLSDFSSSIYQVGKSIWTVQTVEVGGKSAIRWYEIDGETNKILQSGTIADSGYDYFFPSIAVNEFGDVVIGFSRSGLTEYISSYAVVGQTVNKITTFAAPQLLKAGTNNYNLSGDGKEKWGNYSATNLDPSDPYSFWTIQGFAAGTDNWGTQITQIKINRTIPNPSGVITQPTKSIPEAGLCCGLLTVAVVGVGFGKRKVS